MLSSAQNGLAQNAQFNNLVENKVTHSVKNAEMHVFTTRQRADQILLKFDNPILSSMIEGKKVMHLDKMSAFDFLPGESLILPAEELMTIDFPDADLDNPTRCLAMEISSDLINNTISYLNETHPKEEGLWDYADYKFHFTNEIALQQILHRLFFLVSEDHPSKDVFADFMLRELVIRILQTKSKAVYTEKTLQFSSNNRLAYIIKHIRENLDQKLTVKNLSKKACMSESNFHRVFKNELDISPIDFINTERIKLASTLLKNPHKKIKEVSAQCGFNSLSYFNRQFKKYNSLSPKLYKQKIFEMNIV